MGNNEMSSDDYNDGGEAEGHIIFIARNIPSFLIPLPLTPILPFPFPCSPIIIHSSSLPIALHLFSSQHFPPLPFPSALLPLPSDCLYPFTFPINLPFLSFPFPFPSLPQSPRPLTFPIQQPLTHFTVIPIPDPSIYSPSIPSPSASSLLSSPLLFLLPIAGSQVLAQIRYFLPPFPSFSDNYSDWNWRSLPGTVDWKQELGTGCGGQGGWRG